MARLPDPDETIAILRAVAAAPTAPYHEHRVLAAIRSELERLGLETQSDEYDQLFTRRKRGEAKRALALVAHADHPAFEVIEAHGREGRARVSGGLRGRCFGQPVPVLVHDDSGPSFRATLDDYVRDVDVANNSPGHARVHAEHELALGQWATLDLPAVEVAGDEVRMAAADDLAGCALVVGALTALADEERPFDVHAAFTRAEETGLFGARLIAEAGTLPRDAYVVSVEASSAAYARPGGGIVVRAGDLHNTFSNEAERYLRVAQERLAAADPAIATQRRLLVGGTCEASAFVRLGYVATGVALPNVNYHNDADGTFAPEIVRLSDLRSGIALVAEAAVAAGEDASESWWPSARRVPEGIRQRLRGPLARGSE